MNYINNAKKVEMFMEKEFEIMFPLTMIDESTILYKQFKIQLSKNGFWNLSRLNGDTIHEFKYKSTAIVAAEYYSKSLYRHIEEIKCLDFEYWSSSNDINIYKYNITKTSDQDVKDILISRLWSARDKTKFLRKEIIKRLSIEF